MDGGQGWRVPALGGAISLVYRMEARRTGTSNCGVSSFVLQPESNAASDSCGRCDARYVLFAATLAHRIAGNLQQRLQTANAFARVRVLVFRRIGCAWRPFRRLMDLPWLCREQALRLVIGSRKVTFETVPVCVLRGRRGVYRCVHAGFCPKCSIGTRRCAGLACGQAH